VGALGPARSAGAQGGAILDGKAVVKKALWRTWYSLLAWYTERRGASFHCMNWGYDDGRALVDDSEPERYSLQLYRAVAEGLPLEGQLLVDVSCGRGGGIHHLAKVLGHVRAIGVDYAPRNLEICRRRFGADAVEFRRGDAENLEFLADASVGAVISVEASHCYPRPERFVAEARRVLAPGGWLLWTDFAPRARVGQLRALAEARFGEVEYRNITPHVLSASVRDRDRRVDLVRRHSARWLHSALLNFAAADEECETFRRFVAGEYDYFLFRAR